MGKKVSEVMTKRLVTVESTTTLTEASKIMREKSIRHLIVIDSSSGAFLGMMSDRDVKKFMSPFIGSTRATPQDMATAQIEVGKVMVSKDKVVAAKPDEEVKSAVDKMLTKKFGSLPVLDEQGKAIGIVTRGDMLKLLMSFL
jgi:acetoin utilization protein AcuB